MTKLIMIAAAALIATPALLITPAMADLPGELSTAQAHAGMASTSTDITMVHKHLQHAVNCLVGPQGKGFDATAGNPCNKAGNGAIADAVNKDQRVKLQAIADAAMPGVTNPDMAAAQATAKSTADALANPK